MKKKNKMKLAFDIGANIGKWSLSNSKKYEKIIAVEAFPECFLKLKENLKHNENIECINYVVHNKDKEITFYESEEYDTISTTNKSWLCSPVSRFYACTDIKEHILPTIKLDDMIKIYGLPDVIKIDVEGGEYETILSLNQKVPYLCFEWVSELKDVYLNCLHHLVKIGFSRFCIQFNDEYTFFPEINEYEYINTILKKLEVTVPKNHWGMIWCC
jgi:FkbM family methyltransferase